jgi:hypothetical protein
MPAGGLPAQEGGGAVKPPNEGGPRKGRPDTTTNAATRIDKDADSVDEILATVRRYESAARAIADNESLTVKARCRALLALSQRGRHEELPAFVEAGIWRGCRHFFEGDRHVPTDLIEACRRLIRQGHWACPECRRPLPSTADLDRWRELGHDLRRPA